MNKKDYKLIYVINELGEYDVMIQQTISSLIGNGIINYNERDKLYDALIDSILIATDKQLDEMVNVIKLKNKFPQYIRGIIYRMAKRSRSKFRYENIKDKKLVYIDDVEYEY